MSRRRSDRRQFGVPLSLPTSSRLVDCYGMHGRAFAHQAPYGAPVRLALINAAREIRWEDGQLSEWAGHSYRCAATTIGDGWRVLGCVMSDGSLPMGKLDAVDPELAQYRWLREPNYVPPADPARTTGPIGIWPLPECDQFPNRLPPVE